MYTLELLVVYGMGMLFLINYDAMRLRVLRRSAVQLFLAFIAIGNNLRVLVRERTSGAQLQRRVSPATVLGGKRRTSFFRLAAADRVTRADYTFTKDTVCILYCARYRTLVRIARCAVLCRAHTCFARRRSHLW